MSELQVPLRRAKLGITSAKDLVYTVYYPALFTVGENLATQCSVRGSKPRRERTREYRGAPTCSCPQRFAFRSMAAVIEVFAVRLKVQLYGRDQRGLFPRTQSRE
jgi:hypothetical protein